MRFSIIAFASMASAAAIPDPGIPGPNRIGYWDAYYTSDIAANGDNIRNITAVYHNDIYGVTSTSTNILVRKAGSNITSGDGTNMYFNTYFKEDWASPHNVVLYLEQENIMLDTVNVWVQGTWDTGCKPEGGDICKAHANVRISAALA